MLGNLYREPHPPCQQRFVTTAGAANSVVDLAAARLRRRPHKSAQECSCPLIGDMIGERYAYHARA